MSTRAITHKAQSSNKQPDEDEFRGKLLQTRNQFNQTVTHFSKECSKPAGDISAATGWTQVTLLTRGALLYGTSTWNASQIAAFKHVVAVYAE